MDRRSTSTGPGRVGRSVGRSCRSRAAGRDDWSCSILRTSRRSRAASSRLVPDRPARARSRIAREPCSSGWDPRRGMLLEPWMQARRRWRGEVRRLAERGPRRRGHRRARVLRIDRVPAWSSSGCGRSAPRRHGVDEIASWLRAFRDAGVDGLPVGPVASAVLADAVLAAGDDALRVDRCELHPLGGRRRDLRRRSPGEGRGTRCAPGGVGIARSGDARAEDRRPGRSAARGGVGGTRRRTCARRPPRCDNRAT